MLKALLATQTASKHLRSDHNLTSKIKHAIKHKTSHNANEGCNSCASLAGLVLCFIACFILLVNRSFTSTTGTVEKRPIQFVA